MGGGNKQLGIRWKEKELLSQCYKPLGPELTAWQVPALIFSLLALTFLQGSYYCDLQIETSQTQGVLNWGFIILALSLLLWQREGPAEDILLESEVYFEFCFIQPVLLLCLAKQKLFLDQNKRYKTAESCFHGSLSNSSQHCWHGMHKALALVERWKRTMVQEVTKKGEMEPWKPCKFGIILKALVLGSHTVYEILPA